MNSNKKSRGNFHQQIGSGGREYQLLKTKRNWTIQLKKMSNPLQAPKTECVGPHSLKISNLENDKYRRKRKYLQQNYRIKIP